MSLDTRESLVHSAELLLRSKGYAAFSYADLEKMVGIRKASIHHHFPTKEDLGVVVVEAYIGRTMQKFERIEVDIPSAIDRLGAFTNIFKASTADGALPLCGALAAEMAVLPEKLQSLAKHFFELQLRWLEKIIDAGVAKGELSSGGDTGQKAYQILSLLEGASFIGWAIKGNRRIDPSIIGRIVGAA